MNTVDIIIALAVAAIIAFAVIIAVRRRRRGTSCCGNCGGCPIGCGNDKDEAGEK